MKIKRISIFGNPEKLDINQAVNTIIEKAANRSVEINIQDSLADVVGRTDLSIREDQLAECSDIVIALGGDGTMLRAARALLGSSVPLMGVNLGALGYLTDVPLSELPGSIDLLLAGDFTVVERKRLSGLIKNGNNKGKTFEALNDIVVNMGSLARPLLMEIIIDGVRLGKFLGDGLIVSTPTGSTAYSLSAGGSIVHPAVSAILVTPICPHSLAVRPLLAPEGKVELVLHDAAAGAMLSADGQVAGELGDGDRISYTISEHKVKLIKFRKNDFFRAMRRKLQWGAIKRRSYRK
ncbi:NAD(+)/NADH kinase [bacterium]|nr:NAD(+)/NADH kinase [bacterium]MBT4292085.1 NAD(+)/NADH kinase [bacterium]